MDLASGVFGSVTNGLSSAFNSVGGVLTSDLGTAVVWTIIDNVNQSFLSPMVSSATAPLGAFGGYAWQTANNVVALVKLKVREGH